MENVPEFVARCVFYGRARPDDIEEFSGQNHDVLCARLLVQLERIASFCERDQVHPSVTQGPRDQGGDVILRFGRRGRGDSGLLVFQVKSDDELDAGLSKVLKAGFFDSKSHYKRMDRYYIALFGASGKTAKRITAINTEFANSEIVRVVGPESLAKFLSLDREQIEGIRRRMDGVETWTFEEGAAEDATQFDSDDELYFALACMFRYFESGSNVLPDAFYGDDSRLKERFEDERIADLRGRFMDDLIEVWAIKDDVLRTENLPGIEAMYRSLVASRKWDADSAFAYMFSFLKGDVTDRGI